jgi:hypothetical protein
MEPVAGFGLWPRFRYEENTGFPSETQHLSLPVQREVHADLVLDIISPRFQVSNSGKMERLFYRLTDCLDGGRKFLKSLWRDADCD